MKTLYLYTTFARSLDNYHNKYGFTHFISSVFYFDKLLNNYSIIARFFYVKYNYILYISPLDIDILDSFGYTDVSNMSVDGPIVRITDGKVAVFEMSLLWLFLNYIKSHYYEENKFEEFLLEIFTQYGPENNELTIKNVLKNTLFIFTSTN